VKISHANGVLHHILLSTGATSKLISKESPNNQMQKTGAKSLINFNSSHPLLIWGVGPSRCAADFMKLA
jgi:hypothetical protein